MTRRPILYGADGTPQPPTDIVARLEERGLKLYKFPDENPRWGILSRWREDDPRREMIRKGEMSPGDDFDIIGYLPMDCPLEEVPTYLERQLRQHPREDIARLADRMRDWNEKGLAEQQVEEVVAAAAENNFGVHDKKVSGRRTRHPKQ